MRSALAACALLAAQHAFGLDALSARADADPTPKLSSGQTDAFRAWMVRIIDAQLVAGPTPRWEQRDCAGLVRFAVAEALRAHDTGWLNANGIGGRLPPELELTPEQQPLRHNWRLADGKRSSYVGALELVQENAAFVSHELNAAAPGDLLLFDQGDDQHLMVWTGRYIAYHTGTSSNRDNGLRAVSVKELMNWRDTRWQPAARNPNFLGVYRLRFLAR
ncbi:MAG TPA: DUF1175 family protein [Burkholderiales bacterium]|nr:DUF1175 family protein [Burkholderiales bacterium]